MEKFNEIKKKIRDIALTAYNEQLVAGTSGNVSCFDHESGIMAITPTDMNYKIMEPEDVVLMKLDGTVVSGGQPSSEWRMHAGIYAKRDDVNAVIHTHSPYATSFAVTHEDIPVVLIEMMPFLGGDIKVSPFGMPGTAELAENALGILEKRNSCLLMNHGVLVIGKDLDQAYIRAQYVEDAARIYHYAREVGKPVEIEESILEIMRAKYGLKK
ncbi:MAG: class II aldolase/adducin family protein [Eubacteriales bacterium]|nr:class II aldolase/adducin family protein [Eubacteriales bacterium]